MKRENPRLSTALLLGLFGNVLLCSQTAYWTRIGLLLLPASCLVLSGVAAAFAVAWRQVGDNRLLRRGWLLILVVSSALELLRMWRLVDTVYPDSLRLLGVCIMLLAPVMKVNEPEIEKKELLFQALGVGDVRELGERVTDILKKGGFPTALSQWKVKKEDLDHLASLGLTKGRADNNPVDLTPEMIKGILEEIY